MNMKLNVALLVGFFACLSTPLFAQSFNVVTYGADVLDNSTDDAPAVRDAINAASAAGGGVVYFPAGVYNLGSDPNSSDYQPCSIQVFDRQNIHFRGAGAQNSEIRFLDRNHHGFYLQQSSSITFGQLKMVYDRPAHLEGRIVSYSPSVQHPMGGYSPAYVVELHPEYWPFESDPYLSSNDFTSRQFEPFDSVTRRRKNGSQAVRVDYLEALQTAHQFRVYTTLPDSEVGPAGNNTAPGTDYCAITTERVRNVAQRITNASVVRSTQCTYVGFQDIQFHNSPFFVGFHTQENAGISYRRCSVTPDPDLGPKGALISSNRDVFRAIQVRGHITIEDCEVVGSGDDAIALYSELYEIAQSSGTRAFIRNLDNPGWSVDVRAGDAIEWRHPVHMTYVGDTTIANVEPMQSNGRWVTLNGTMPPLNTVGSNRRAHMANHVIQRNVIRQSRARCIFSRASNGVILDNICNAGQLGGIVLGPDIDVHYKEGHFVRNVVVGGNTIYGNSYGKNASRSTHTFLGGLTVGISHAQSQWPTGIGNYNVALRDNWVGDNRFHGIFLGSINTSNIERNYLIANQLEPTSVAGSLRGITPNSADGMMHLQNGVNVVHSMNRIDTRLGQAPHRTISGATGTNGSVLAGDMLEGAADSTNLASTSFEMEESWSPALPKFAGTYRANGTWQRAVGDLSFKFSNWGLYGNHHRWHFYNGWVTTWCGKPNGWMEVWSGSRRIKRLTFRAAANTPPSGVASDWSLRIRGFDSLTNSWKWLKTVEPESLPYPPLFGVRTLDVPSHFNITKIRFVRLGGNQQVPYLYLDDVMLEF